MLLHKVHEGSLYAAWNLRLGEEHQDRHDYGQDAGSTGAD